MSEHLTSEIVQYKSLAFLELPRCRVGSDGSVWATKSRMQNKLRESDAIQIKHMIEEGKHPEKIAGLFGVTSSVIYNIKAGRIWNQIGEWRRLKVTMDRYGYPRVCLSSGSVRKIYQIHRLVLMAFVGLRPAGMQCRHLDGNPANNRIENLCWGTPKENADDRVAHGTNVYKKGEECGASKYSEEQVLHARSLHATGKYTLKQIEAVTGIPKCNLFYIVHRRTWKHI